jgi:hypothetical protein
MTNLYYRIWSDAIFAAQAKRSEAGSWKAFTLIPMSLLMGSNLLTFFIWMKKLVNHYLPLYFPVSIFSSRLINDAIAIVLTLFIPFLILNYLLIFTNDRYKTIMAECGSAGGKLYRNYVFISIGIFAIPLIIQIMFS